MSHNIRLLIFGLPRGMPGEQMHALIAPCGDSRLEVLDLPGDNDQSMAVLQLGENDRLAQRLSERVRHQRVAGRRLQAWLTALPWA